MKNENKLQQISDRLTAIQQWTATSEPAHTQAIEAAKLLREFIADNTTTPGRGDFHCKDFVIKDKKDAEIRPVMTCVYHDPEYHVAVATDAHHLLVSEHEYIPTDGSHLRDPYGEVSDIDGKFPKWKSVLPIKKHTVTIRQDIAEVLAKAYAECKVQGRQRKDIIVLVDGEHWQNHFHTTCIMKAGIDGWEAGDPIFSDEKPGSRAMVKTWDGYTLLLMPMLIDATDQEIAAGWCFREK